jgi:hypothetical protein
MIEGQKITFWGKDIESKIIPLTPEAVKIINDNDISTSEPRRFIDDNEFKLFSLLYYSK